MSPMETANIRPRGRPRIFAADEVARIVSLYNQGSTMSELAWQFGTSKQTISNTLRRHNKQNAPACDEQNGGDSLTCEEYRREQFTSDGAA